MNLKSFENKTIYFCGIGGIGMSSIAGYLLESNIQNIQILGSSDKINENITRLQNLTNNTTKIEVNIGHKAEYINKNIDFFIYTEVISKNNPEYMEALALNLNILSRGEFLAIMSNDFKHNINITGTHGKTTTTGMIGFMLDFCKKKPSIICGGLMKNYKNNYLCNETEYFVKEADESSDSFLKLNSEIAIITSIEEDHLENHKNIDNIFDKFIEFSEKTNKLIVCNEYEYCQKLIQKLKESKNIISYGLNNSADLYPENINYQENFIKFDIIFKKKKIIKNFKIKMYGKHNILNTLASVAVGIYENINLLKMKQSFLKFKGISNRFDICGQKNFNIIINDYAHNPSKIKSAIDSALHLKNSNKKYQNSKIIIFFEPHKHSRVKSLMQDFALSFQKADKLYILDIFKSYEINPEIVEKETLRDEIIKNSKAEICLIKTCKKTIKKEIFKSKNNIILFLSAGNYNLACEI